MENVKLLNSTKETPSKDLTSDEKQLVEVIKIEDTPFDIIKHDKSFRLVIGKYIVSNEFDNIEDCKNQISDINWELVINTVVAIIKSLKIQTLTEN